MKKIAVTLMLFLAMAAVSTAYMCDTPTEFREENWLGMSADGYQGGSCGWASTVMALRCCGQYDLAAHYRETYGGGVWEQTLIDAANENGLEYDYTMTGDRKWMMWAIHNRLPVVAWYYQSHCILVVGQYKGNIVIMDNNYTDRYRLVPIDEFFINWKETYGGFGMVFLYQPLPPWPIK